MRGASEELARVMTLEQGKPLTEARGEIEYAASFLDWFAAEGERFTLSPSAAAGAHRRCAG